MTDPQFDTHHGVLLKRAAAHGERAFIVTDSETVTFAALERQARAVAGNLQRLGIRKGDVVALMMGNRPQFLAIWFGIAMAGGVFAPINPAHRGHVLRHMLAIARTRIVIFEPQFAEQLLSEVPHLPDLIHLVGEAGGGAVPVGCSGLESLFAPAEPTHVEVLPSDPGMIMFTSGTTGPSKGALKPHNEAVWTGRMTCDVMHYTADDVLYMPLPLFHGNALVMGAFAALTAGARIVLAERFSAQRYWHDIARHGCTATNYSGGIIPILAKAEPKPDDAATPLVKMFGAGCPPHLLEAFEARFGVTLTEGYGMSDMGVPFLNRPGARKPGTCGRLQKGFAVKLVDDAGAEVPDGTPGELLVRPDIPHYLMLGYVGMPEKTVEAWRDLWFHTGDFLQRDPDGYYRFVDRKKDAIRRRGENISSFEVEASVNRHPDVLESAALGVASDLGEQDVLVCVVARPGHAIDAAALHGFLRTQMAAFMVPRYIRVLDSLPKTATERVEKFRLREEGAAPGTHDFGDGRAQPSAS
jgi:crotonobetaine/carnitine-CoA ligase